MTGAYWASISQSNAHFWQAMQEKAVKGALLHKLKLSWLNTPTYHMGLDTALHLSPCRIWLSNWSTSIPVGLGSKISEGTEVKPSAVIFCLQDGTAPLWIASQMGHSEVVRVMLLRGAERDAARDVSVASSCAPCCSLMPHLGGCKSAWMEAWCLQSQSCLSRCEVPPRVFFFPLYLGQLPGWTFWNKGMEMSA